MRIDVGAGASPMAGFLSVDVNPRRCDVCASALELPFRTGSVEAMRAVDVLEHVSYRDTHRVLTEWARVCARGAELYVQVPDAHAIMLRYVEWSMDPNKRRKVRLPIPAKEGLAETALNGAQWRLLGGHDDNERVNTAAGDDWRWNAHYALFDRPALTAALDVVGFDVIDCPTNPFPNLCCTARRR